MPIRLQTLGELDLRGPDDRALRAIMTQPKRTALLTWLALAEPSGFHRRDVLLALLWPDHDQQHARGALRQALHGLRAALGEDVLLTRGDEVGLDFGRFTCDARLLEEAAQRGAAQEVIGLYRGEFLSGFFLTGAPEFERWVESVRGRLRRTFTTMLERQAGGLATDPARAAEYWRRLAEQDPYSSRVAVQLMQALDASGDAPAAIRHAGEHATFLHENLGADPDPEVSAHAERLKHRARARLGPPTAPPVTTQAAAAPPVAAGRTLPPPHAPWRVVRHTAIALLLLFGGGVAWLVARSPTHSLRAWQLYLEGTAEANRWNRGSIDRAIAALEGAVAADSHFARAHAALANAYLEKADLFDPGNAALSTKAYVAVETALLLDSTLADAYLARGNLLWTDANGFPHEAALRAFHRAAELEPRSGRAHDRLALIYFHVGLLDRAMTEARAAYALDPLSFSARFRIGHVLLYQGRVREAAAILGSLPDDVAPGPRGPNIAEALLVMGQRRAAMRVLDSLATRFPADPWIRATRAVVLAATGDPVRARAEIRAAAERARGYAHGHHAEYAIGQAYATLGTQDSALYWLARAAAHGMPCYPRYANDPLLAPLRDDPRFAALLGTLREQGEYFARTFPERRSGLDADP